ncbi:TPA: CoA transferase [Streptococcus suis]|nr:CoA transferase [Streptococcus suis]
MSLKKPLEGIKVVELGTFIAVPTATRWLADWGAEVIKIEGLQGDDWRHIGPGFRTPKADDENPLFTVQNANKKLLALNLKTKEGLKILFDLIKEADVFITNVRLKSLEKMNISYETVKAVNEKIIYAHFTGYGYEGPAASRPGFDMAAFWARTGAMVDWGSKGDFPIKPLGGFGDSTVASVIALGIMGALYGRTVSGKGTFLTSSLYGTGIWYNATGVVATQERYGAEYPKHKMAPGSPTNHIYQSSDDQWVIITLGNYERQAPDFYRLLGLDEYAEHPDTETIAILQAHPDTLKELMEKLYQVFRTKTMAEWTALFDEADIVYEVLKHNADVSKDEQAWANNYLREVTFESGNTAVMPNLPVTFSEYDTFDSYQPTGRIGRDSEEILKALGYSDEEFKAFIDSNVTL